MLLVAKGITDRCDEAEEQDQEDGGEGSYHGKRGGKYGIGPSLSLLSIGRSLIVRKAEQGSLHAEGEQYQNQGGVGIHIRTDAVVA